MAHFAQRLSAAARSKRGRIVIGIAGVAIILLLWLAVRGMSGAASSTAAEQSLVVRPQAFSITSSFTGRVAPGDRLEVVAPFDAAVSRVHFAYGDQVQAGQVLLELNPADVARSRAEAEASWLSAEDAAAKMQTWERGPEMARAHRALSAAEAEMEDLQRKLAETRSLLDRGLVARSEYEGLQQQERTRRAGLVQAQEELDLTRRRGQGAERRIAVLKKDVAWSQYASLAAAAGSTVIRAPAAGVLVRPQSTGGEAGDEALNVGTRVTRGQSLGVVARTEGLDVTFQLDESDVNAVTPGQPVTVTGPGFGGIVLKGRVSGVAGEATGVQPGAKAVFTAVVRLDPLTAEAAKRVRIGMTANLSVISYETASAIVVPPEAVQGVGSGAVVTVRDGPGGKPRQVAVSVGRVGPTGVEILSGLRAGDTVVWTAASRPPAP